MAAYSHIRYYSRQNEQPSSLKERGDAVFLDNLTFLKPGVNLGRVTSGLFSL